MTQTGALAEPHPWTMPRIAGWLASGACGMVGAGVVLLAVPGTSRAGAVALVGSLLLLMLGEAGMIKLGRREVRQLSAARKALLEPPGRQTPESPRGAGALPGRAELAAALAAAMLGAPAQAVLMLGIRRLQALRDTYGEPAVEQLEQAVAARIRQLMRTGDMVAGTRPGELAILPSVKNEAEAGVLAGRLVEHVAGRYQIDGKAVRVGVRIGVAMAPAHGTEAPELMRHALVALRLACAEHGWWRAYAPHMLADAAERTELEADLVQALPHQQLELHYQPVVDVARNRIGCFEALLRWRHPERGLVPTTQFITLAEESGHITRIGAWVLDQACRDAMNWPADVRVAVNLSGVQVRGEGLLEAVRHALDASGLLPARLELEVTETVLLEGDAASRRVLHALRAMGVRIAMDDFGTGHSSLSYLRDFPFDKIKIDQSFVRHIGSRADCLAIVRAVTGLGAALGIAVTAEGAEDLETVERLRAEGCTEVQGYYFSRPVPASDVPRLLGRSFATGGRVVAEALVA